MALALSLPEVDAHPAQPPETRPSKVAEWLDSLAKHDPADAARAAAHALAATNRVALSDARRFELAEQYWLAAGELWPLLERRFAQVQHPLSGGALDAAKAALGLSQELSVAYKHLLAREADRRVVIGAPRQLGTVLNRCVQSMARTINNSYLAYSPVPVHTWLDLHRIYAFARDRGQHLEGPPGQPDVTPERIYVQVLLLALANPYGFSPGQLGTVLRYLQTHAQCAKLTEVQPVHRMAKAVAIIPVGHDFPPFSANKGGAIEGRKMYLLTFDLAFEMQEQLRALDAGAELPVGIARDPVSRRSYIALLRRLLRQWAIPPARQFNRVAARAAVATCAGLPQVWQYARAMRDRAAGKPTPLPAATSCEVVNHTPAGYALRQTDAKATALRVGELIAITVEGRGALQIAIVRWFRNPLDARALEFGCELLCDAPEPACAAPEGGGEAERSEVMVLPHERAGKRQRDNASPRIVVPAQAFRLEQAITLQREAGMGFGVLTKLVEQGPGFELYDFVPVG